MSTHNEENNDDITLLNYMNNYYNQKSIPIQGKDNILMMYLKDNNIIKDKKLLPLFIKELLIQIRKGNNIILPFIDSGCNLIQAYFDNIKDEECQS